MAFTYDGSPSRARSRRSEVGGNARRASSARPAAARRRLPADGAFSAASPASTGSCRRSRRRSSRLGPVGAPDPRSRRRRSSPRRLRRRDEPAPPDRPPRCGVRGRGAGARRRRRPDQAFRVPRESLPRRLGAGTASGRSPRRRPLLRRRQTSPRGSPQSGPASEAAAPPLVTETLAALYESQGFAAEARETYRTLARRRRPTRTAQRALRDKASALPSERADRPHLRRLARRFPKRTEATANDLHAIIRSLVESTEGIRAATLTDLEGLPVVAAGPTAREGRPGDPRRRADVLPQERRPLGRRGRRRASARRSRSPARTGPPSCRA